jgi:hypothetical protein
MTSEAQINANRRNAQLSTGPRTEAGKARSRQNSLKQGLTGAGIVQPAAEAAKIAQRTRDWSPTIQPKNSYQAWLLGQAATDSVRLERCAVLDMAQRGLVIERAATQWDHDRSLAVQLLAARLALQPALVTAQLRQSKQGCDWLIARWEALEKTLAANGCWSEAQRSRAFDLLGVEHDERPIDDRLTAEDPGAIKACVRAQVEQLESLKSEALDHLDATEQSLTEEGLSFDMSLPARLLRRYEAACRRGLEWALKQLRKGKPAQSMGSRPSQPRSASASALSDLERFINTSAPRLTRPPEPASIAASPVPAAPAQPQPSPAPESFDEILAPPPATAVVPPIAKAHVHMNRKDRRAVKKLERTGR